MGLLNQRRKLIVDREVQYDLLMYVGLFVAFVFLSQILVAAMFLHKLETKAALGELGSMSIAEFIAKFKVVFLIYELFAVSACAVVGFYFLNRLTSRIVGPLYNIRRILHLIKVKPESQIEIKLRKDDYFHELVDDLNTALKRDNVL
ncbi:HAMP domain-containing protein [Bdellovibrio svalbardensis]|uniref:HAMP domain-containing protein n=1 Tax=Bdellovibrio svalbardensis TaxID=2972972 RepID=A0ABT6DLI1_9BACT|nr:HAMP domain-containing protein [Bdellovibrio svalbardensis]MDG0815988.1 HAMP domain-containing protein [Bdellovibrio svalbardensis]